MLKGLSQIEFAVSALLLVVIVALVFVAAVARFFDHPIIWSVDTAQLLFIWLCMIGATRAMRQKSHFGIDLLIRWAPQNVRFWLEAAMTVLVLMFLGALTVKGTELTLSNMPRRFGDSGISYAWVTAAVPVGALLIGMALVGNAVLAVRARMRGEEMLIYSRPDAILDTEL